MWLTPKSLQGGMVSLFRGTTEPPHCFFLLAAGFESGGDDKLRCGIVAFSCGKNRVDFVGSEVRCELPANYSFQRVKRGFFLEHVASLEQSASSYDERVAARVARRVGNLEISGAA